MDKIEVKEKNASPGHKLGQMIGVFFEEIFEEVLIPFSEKNGYYCDIKGPRPKVRGNKKKVSWYDNDGNKHDLDFVIEKNGAQNVQGKPVAFIELAWRRYTKHSINKAGEIEGALLHLRDTYQSSCRFIGAIISGEWTEGGINQMKSHNIEVLYIPFSSIAECFLKKEIDLSYPQDAEDALKQQTIEKIQSLSEEDRIQVKEYILEKIQPQLEDFLEKLKFRLNNKIKFLRILPLFGEPIYFSSIEEVKNNLLDISEINYANNKFQRYELLICFENGNQVEGKFNDKATLISFLDKVSE